MSSSSKAVAAQAWANSRDTGELHEPGVCSWSDGDGFARVLKYDVRGVRQVDPPVQQRAYNRQWLTQQYEPVELIEDGDYLVYRNGKRRVPATIGKRWVTGMERDTRGGNYYVKWQCICGHPGRTLDSRWIGWWRQARERGTFSESRCKFCTRVMNRLAPTYPTLTREQRKQYTASMLRPDPVRRRR